MLNRKMESKREEGGRGLKMQEQIPSLNNTNIYQGTLAFQLNQISSVHLQRMFCMHS